MNCPRCGKPVDEHEAGRCLDAWFAEVVMGWVRLGCCPLYGSLWDDEAIFNAMENGGFTHRRPCGCTGIVPKASTSITAAWEGLDQFRRFSFHRGTFFWCAITLPSGRIADALEAPTAPLAIVRACLKAKLAEKEADDELS